jgi:hypothetical protein
MKLRVRLRLCPRHLEEFMRRVDADLLYQAELPVKGGLCNWMGESFMGCPNIADYVVEGVVDAKEKL